MDCRLSQAFLKMCMIKMFYQDGKHAARNGGLQRQSRQKGSH